MPSDAVDVSDVQGLVRFGFGHLTEACYLLLRIRDAASARAWLTAALPLVSTAVKLPQKPSTAMQVAFTVSGLRAIGVGDEVVSGFSAEFVSGMAGDQSRSRRLGDIGANAPDGWEWGGPGSEPDVLVILLADVGMLEDWRRQVESGSFHDGFETLACLPTSNLHNNEPFGFRDGISQPDIDWPRQRTPGTTELTYTNIVALGEFLLGYPNEYGKYTDRPLLDPLEEYADYLLSAEDDPSRKDLCRNGTYLVIRQLEQDVRGFWRFADQAAKSDPKERLRLAEAMVGREIGGDPLAPLNPSAIPGVDYVPGAPSNCFTYDQDPEATRCPFGAHLRRANPRNVDLPGRPAWFLSRWLRMLGWGIKSFRDDALASTRFHRILRRGREYGPGLGIEDALRQEPANDPKRGLNFVCLNANISRGFEFVQGAWLMSTTFNGLNDENDPVLGNAAAAGDCPYTGNFSIPRVGAPPQVLAGMQQVVTVRGGAYFFLPSLSALRYFCRRPTQTR